MRTIYNHNDKNTVRYTLGSISENSAERPMFCFGINPSTATPEKLDPTVTRVYKFSERLGFTGVMMFNVYPQRATDPNNMHTELNAGIHRKNLEYIRKHIKPGDTVVAAWGTVIKKRPYLRAVLEDVIKTVNECGGKWYCFGNPTKEGHPRHPLYLRGDTPIQPFDVESYLQRAFSKKSCIKESDPLTSELEYPMVNAYLDELYDIAGLPYLTDTQKQQYYTEVMNNSFTHKILLSDESTGKTVGFLLMGTSPNCHPDADYYIEEAYVAPKYRRQGYMTNAVKKFAASHPGKYCMFILKRNTYAHEFWRKLFGSIGYDNVELSDVGAADETCSQYGFAPAANQ